MSQTPIIVLDLVFEKYRHCLHPGIRERTAFDATLAKANGLTRDQYTHVLSTFSHASYKDAPRQCLAAFHELQQIGLETFTKNHDPYWDIPLNEYLPQPVIDLPIPEAAPDAAPAPPGSGEGLGRKLELS